MKLNNRKLISFILIITISFVFYSSSLRAEKDAYLLQPETHSVLSEVHKAMEKTDFSTAKIKLQTLLQSDKLKDYDKAVIYQTMGYIENGLTDFDAAAASFQKSLSFNALPKQVTHDLYYTTAQLLIHTEKTEAGLKYLAKWFADEPNPKADAHILAASAYYQAKNYPQLIAHVNKALALSKHPPLNWYELLLAAYYQTKNYNKAAEVLELIIIKYPDKPDYWLQLAGIYQRTKQEKKALAVYELAYAKDILKEQEKIQLVKNYLYLEMPYKAANVLEKELAIGGIKDNKEMLELLVDSWLLAQEREKAESVLIEIIKRFNEDKARLRLGQIYIESEAWEKARTLLDVKLKSKDKTLHSKINLLLGIAEYHTDNMNKANRAFKQALTDKSTKDQAEWWLEHLRKKAETNQKS